MEYNSMWEQDSLHSFIVGEHSSHHPVPRTNPDPFFPDSIERRMWGLRVWSVQCQEGGQAPGTVGTPGP